MKNNFILTISFLTLSLFSCNEKKEEGKPAPNNVFARLDYDQAVAYDYDGEGDIEIIDKETGQLAPKIKKQIILDKAKAIKITNELCDKSSYGGAIADCFNPHLGIVFYKVNKPVAYISICLDCNYLVSSLKIEGAEGGFSDKGIKSILDFEKQIGY